MKSKDGFQKAFEEMVEWCRAHGAQKGIDAPVEKILEAQHKYRKQLK